MIYIFCCTTDADGGGDRKRQTERVSAIVVGMTRQFMNFLLISRFLIVTLSDKFMIFLIEDKERRKIAELEHEIKEN